MTASSAEWLRAGEEMIPTDPDRSVRLLEGRLIIRIAECAGGSPGRRFRGFAIEPGMTFFGLPPGEMCLVASAVTDSRIEERAVADPGMAGEIPGLWAEWIRCIQNNLSPAIRKGYAVMDDLPGTPGERRIGPGQCIRFTRSPDSFLVCRVIEGRLHDAFSAMSFEKGHGFFPAPEGTLLCADTETSLEVVRPDAVNPAPGLLHETCRRWFLKKAEAIVRDHLLEEERRMAEWIQQEDRFYDAIRRKTPISVGDAESERIVFGRVLAHLGIEEKRCSHTDDQEDGEQNSGMSKELIRMAEDCGVRIRKVKLAESWWTEDSGPLLVIGTDGTLLAAVPDKPGRYVLYDEKGIVAKDSRIPDIPLEKTGYMVYPVFPDKKLTLYDIIYFIIRSIWKRDVVFLVLFGMVAGLLATAIPLATGVIFSEAIPYQNYSLAFTILVILFMSILSSAIFQLAREIAVIRLEGRIGSYLEAAVWDRLLKLPPSFFRNYSAGNLASRAGVVDEIRMILSGVTITVILSAVFSIFNIIVMFRIYPDIAWYAVLLVLLVFLLSLCIGYLSIVRRKALLEIQGHLAGITFQLLSGISRIAVAGAQNRAFLWWEKDYRKQISLRLEIGTLNAYSTALMVLWPGLLTILVFALAGYQLSIVQPERAHGWFLAFYAAVGAFSAAFVGLGGSFISLWNIKPMWDWVSPILTTETEVQEGHEAPGHLTGSLEVRHVTFSYSREAKPVLEDVSITVNPGEFVAIVGASGSGKSTLLRLLLGFEKPDSGSILYDQKSLSNLNIRAVRKQIGVVLQDGQLMAGSIFNNIAGSRMLTPEEVWEAAALAGIDQEIQEMPMQMHTFISEGSGNISGGQKQRLLIARAIASRPRIVLLDEATSALDNVTQRTVMQSLENLKMTRVIIAHRLSSILHADRIYVLDQGRVVESGTYDELMEIGGYFSELARHQLV